MQYSFSKYATLVLLVLQALVVNDYLFAQFYNETTIASTIHSIKLFKRGDQASLPITMLGQTEVFELHFDDVQNGVKNYFYTYMLCNADWTPANLSQMDYLKGFTQNRLNQYRMSGGTQQRYVHYQALLPERNCVPSRSGNYLLKVFADGDTSKQIFTGRILVIDEKASIAASVQQPFGGNTFRTHQKVISRVDIKALDIYNPQQQIKVVVLQNHNWYRTMFATNPTFIRGKIYEYNAEDNFVFEGGKEWRWLDLRSFRLLSDRVASSDIQQKPPLLFLKPDSIRGSQRYYYYRDLNGSYFLENLENVNPWWQSDYAWVQFTFLPNDYLKSAQQKMYLFGELTNNRLSEAAEMVYNPEKGIYQQRLLLKNGYYNYQYISVPTGKSVTTTSIMATEGSAWETENNYTVLVYYKAFGGRSDELIAYTEVNSLTFLNPTLR